MSADNIINYPIRMKESTRERLKEVLLVARLEEPNKTKVTLEDTLNRLMDFFEANNEVYQQYLKCEALATSNVRS